MNDIDKALIRTFAPAYIAATATVVASLIHIRQINETRKQNRAAHDLRMKEMEHKLRVQTEKHEAWRADQPNLDDIMAKAREEVGSLEDLRRKMEDPNYVFKI